MLLCWPLCVVLFQTQWVCRRCADHGLAPLAPAVAGVYIVLVATLLVGVGIASHRGLPFGVCGVIFIPSALAYSIHLMQPYEAACSGAWK